jgi:UDP-N-acetylmuramoyl-L-alanyl-D-glutamate--2,6-diaminopimelate ligase
MRLEEVLDSVEVIENRGELSMSISGISYNSKEVIRGNLFIAVKGEKTDGNLFIPEAVNKGAVAVLSEDDPPSDLSDRFSFVKVADVRVALARTAANFFRRPSEELTLIGVTGTNGKTTYTYLMESIWTEAGIPAGRIGTISHSVAGKEITASLTTPEAPDIELFLREMVTFGIKACVIEVSSHSLELSRVSELDFDLAVFTNLTREHLDYHKTMENYFQAKLKLFEKVAKEGGKGVVNLDDTFGRRICKLSSLPLVSYGFSDRADIYPGEYHLSRSGIMGEVVTPEGSLKLSSPLLGRPNLYNILAAIASSFSLDLPLEKVASGITKVGSIPGRFEIVDEGQDFTLIVDYAHTDDALRNLLVTVGELARQRIITVFGCGGDRDRGKRPVMGSYAVKHSDLAIVTSDNPRSEDPMAIIREIERGIIDTADKQGRYIIEPDRRKAIELAISYARRDDFVVLAGKGHEDYQILGDKVIHFDDREVAREMIWRKKGRR